MSFLVYCDFSSAKILNGDRSISEIPVYDWFILADEKNAVNEKTQAVYILLKYIHYYPRLTLKTYSLFF